MVHVRPALFNQEPDYTKLSVRSVVPPPHVSRDGQQRQIRIRAVLLQQPVHFRILERSPSQIPFRSVLEPSAVADRQPHDIQSEVFAAMVIPTVRQNFVCPPWLSLENLCDDVY